MKIPLKTLLLSSVVLTAASTSGQIILAGFEFSNAPTSVGTGPANTTAAAETVAPGFGAANFSVVRQAPDNQSQSGIANVLGSSGVGAAQIAGQDNNTYAWSGSASNYFEFTLDFGTVAAGDISFTSLELTGRTGVQWNETGGLVGYQANRRSTITVRSSLDGYDSNIGAELNPAFANTDASWITASMDLTGLNLLGTEDSVTFRIYTKSTGTAFHRTQLDSVEVMGAIPEPSTYAALFGLLAFGFVAWRRRR